MSNTWRPCSLLLFALLGIALLATAAHATEGTIEINQASAQAGGVTPGDTPGFPVTISVPGSYVLTGNLTVSSLSTSGIVITSPNGVTIDLNGFRIKGACPDEDGCAAGAGSSIGINGSASIGTVLKDGRVRGFASHGVALGANARVFGLFVEGNGGHGISVLAGSEVSDSRTYDNSAAGINAADSSVHDCSAHSNLDGLVIGQRSMVLGNIVFDNSRIGIIVSGPGTTVRGNVVATNATDGIAVTQSGSLVIENVTYGNTAAGISVLASGSVQRNTAFNNGLGLYLVPESTPGGNPAAFVGNVVSGNPAGNVIGGINLGENLCGSALCP